MNWLKTNWRGMAIFMLLIAAVYCTAEYDNYRALAKSEGKRADKAEALAAGRQSTIETIHKQQRDVAALNTKYTQELADAKSNIDQLRRDVSDGRQRLHVNATCKAVSAATATSRVDDAASPRLTDAAEQDYFDLRSGIETSSNMIKGLQQYVREQCLK